jgi:aspartyl-tRNA synthetase
MYEWNEDEKRIDFSHNPFSMPQYDREKFLGFQSGDRNEILGLKVFQYDIVCNGYEMLSGAIRNRDPDVMLKAFEIAGYAREETESRFGGMLNAFRYGAPPHGGLAIGLERTVMLLAGEENIREVTMFPLTQQGQDLLMGAPSPASAKQLKELHLKIVYPEKD